MSFENRHWVIFDASELSKIDFEEVCEHSINTVRKSINGAKSFIKWDGDSIPSSLSGLSAYSGPYNHSEIIEILNTSEWRDRDPENNPDSPHIPEEL